MKFASVLQVDESLFGSAQVLLRPSLTRLRVRGENAFIWLSTSMSGKHMFTKIACRFRWQVGLDAVHAVVYSILSGCWLIRTTQVIHEDLRMCLLRHVNQRVFKFVRIEGNHFHMHTAIKEPADIRAISFWHDA
jgi:hypothetical protein